MSQPSVMLLWKELKEYMRGRGLGVNVVLGGMRGVCKQLHSKKPPVSLAEAASHQCVYYTVLKVSCFTVKVINFALPADLQLHSARDKSRVPGSRCNSCTRSGHVGRLIGAKWGRQGSIPHLLNLSPSLLQIPPSKQAENPPACRAPACPLPEPDKARQPQRAVDGLDAIWVLERIAFGVFKKKQLWTSLHAYLWSARRSR